MPFCALRLVFFAVKMFTTRFAGEHRGLGGFISGIMILGHNDFHSLLFIHSLQPNVRIKALSVQPALRAGSCTFGHFPKTPPA
jgi:hypothetical protein